jgi:hypothetical protein
VLSPFPIICYIAPLLILFLLLGCVAFVASYIGYIVASLVDCCLN